MLSSHLTSNLYQTGKYSRLQIPHHASISNWLKIRILSKKETSYLLSEHELLKRMVNYLSLRRLARLYKWVLNGLRVYGVMRGFSSPTVSSLLTLETSGVHFKHLVNIRKRCNEKILGKLSVLCQNSILRSMAQTMGQEASKLKLQMSKN